MKTLWIWIKDHVVWILGGIATILGILFAIKYERDKISELKREALVSRTRQEISELDARKKFLLEKDAVLQVEDEHIEELILAKKREILLVREEVKERSNAEIAARFNELYPNR